MRHQRRGFTLVEMVAVMAVLATIAAIASQILFVAVDGYVGVSVGGQLQSESSSAMRRLVDEIRDMPLDSGATGIAPDLSAVTATSLDWGAGNRVYLAGTSLQYEENGAAPAVLLSDVTAFNVTALDESALALPLPLAGAACDPVRRLTLEITVSRGGTEKKTRTSVFLRAAMREAV